MKEKIGYAKMKLSKLEHLLDITRTAIESLGEYSGEDSETYQYLIKQFDKWGLQPYSIYYDYEEDINYGKE